MRLLLIGSLLGCVIATGCRSGGAEPVAAEPKPGVGVLVVLIDTLRADHTSLVRHRLGRTTTPFLDQLASEAYVFSRAYSAASWTRPSVASLLTSRLPSSHGCEDRAGRLAPEVLTLAEAFQAQGFDTHGVITNGQVLSLYGFEQGFDRYEHFSDSPRNAYVNARKLTEPVLAAVDDLDTDPFFLYLHYVDPHDPFLEHPETDFDPGYAGCMDGSREALDPLRWDAPQDPADKQRVLDLYDGEILWMDRQLERLFGKLEQRGLLERTWVVVTSDHGEGLWDHRIQSHGQELFEEQVRVPLLVRPPGGLAQRVDITDPISSIDVAPTLLDLMGLPVPLDFEGQSWAAALRNDGPAPVRPVILDEKLNDVHMAAVVDGDRKLILELVKPEEGFSPIQRAAVRSARLYDLESDPHENPYTAVDLTVQWPAGAAAMHRTLVQALSAAELRRAELSVLGAPEESAEQLEALRALGYLGGDQPSSGGAGPTRTDEPSSDDEY